MVTGSVKPLDYMSDILIRANDGFLYDVFANEADTITIDVYLGADVREHTTISIHAAQVLAKQLRKSIAIAKSYTDERVD